MYELGVFVGGLVPTFLVRSLVLLALPWESREAPLLRCVIANVLSAGAVMAVYVLGSANGDPPDWGRGLLIAVPQTLWLVVDIVRWESRRIASDAKDSASAENRVGTIPSPQGLPTSTVDEIFHLPNLSQNRHPTASTALEPSGPSPAVPPLSASRPPEISQAELLFWQSIKDSNDPADFAAYLSEFTNGIFEQLARNKLVALGGSLPPSQPLQVAASAHQEAHHATGARWAQVPSQSGAAPAAGPGKATIWAALVVGVSVIVAVWIWASVSAYSDCINVGLARGNSRYYAEMDCQPRTP